MKSFKQLLNIPGPKDLGMSKSNEYMPIDLWGFGSSDEPTWTDYEKKIKEDFPFKFFIAFTVPNFFRILKLDIFKYVDTFKYYLKCHLLSKHRYHLLSLKQPNKEYEYGWIDSDKQIEYAVFNILTQFVEKEMPRNFWQPTDDEVAQDIPGELSDHSGARNQRQLVNNILECYNYWKTDRFVLDKIKDDALHIWSESMKETHGKDPEKTDVLFKIYHELEISNEKRLTEILHRVIDLRGHLWT